MEIVVGRAWKKAAGEVTRFISSGDLEAAWAALDPFFGGGPASRTLRGCLQELDFLHRATQLAAQYGEIDRAYAWIRSHRERREKEAPLAESVLLAYRLVELGVHWVVRDYEAIKAMLRDIDWREAPASAWIFNLRLVLTASGNSHSEVLDALRRPSPLLQGSPDFRDPHHRGNRLRHLGFYFYERGEARRSLGYLRAALRHYAKDGGIDSRLSEILILGHFGKAAFRQGRLEESWRFLRKAIRSAARFKHWLWQNTFRLEYALMLAKYEQPARAERIAVSVTRRCRQADPRSGLEYLLRIKGFIAAGHFAVEQGAIKRGARHAACAARLLEGSRHPRLPGFLHVLKGRVETWGGTEAAHARALQEFKMAEDCFRGFGDGDGLGLFEVALHRGRLHILRRDVKGALAEAVECMELAKKRGLLSAGAASLLLKSQLLLQEEVPNADRLYEEVLRDLGSVHDKVVLFKVIANLYLYSWELGDQLDLTDWHMQQIHKMRELLDRQTFDCLYERYVTRQVMRRVLVRTFGMDPSLLPQDEPGY